MTIGCFNCKHWETNDHIMRSEGEGCGRCKQTYEITFCDKHNCIMHELADKSKQEGTE